MAGSHLLSKLALAQQQVKGPHRENRERRQPARRNCLMPHAVQLTFSTAVALFS